MNGIELRELLLDALARLALARDELRDLDAAIGDGDLGITVSDGSFAARDVLLALPSDATPGAILRAMGPAVARANPSTFAALVASALVAASRSLGDRATVTAGELVDAGRVAAETIATRGKSAVGDKTILDALVPSLDAVSERPDVPFEAALDAARNGVEATRDMVAMRGRAAWVGERTRGHLDPGATAYLRLLEALAATRADKAEAKR
jgi:dihydroxyacetone kinase-like protein